MECPGTDLPFARPCYPASSRSQTVLQKRIACAPPRVSIVIPMYRSEAMLRELRPRLKKRIPSFFGNPPIEGRRR